MAEFVSVREFARRVGVSHTAIQKAIKIGRIIAEPNGKLDFAKANKAWGVSLSQDDPRQDPAKNKQNKPKATEDQKYSPPEEKPVQSEAGQIPDGSTYIKSRAIREAYQARLIKLEYEIKIGKMIQADDVKVSAFNAARRARDMIMAIPDRVSPILASITNPIELHQVLSDELRKVCAEISGNYVDS